jgi:hypothetical protein
VVIACIAFVLLVRGSKFYKSVINKRKTKYASLLLLNEWKIEIKHSIKWQEMNK